MDGCRHESKPDTDNYIKGIMDCLRSDGDSMITPVCGHKVWAREPKIIFFDKIQEWYDFVTSLGHDI
jgi:Holliday junction resolvase RusA-like endonuclease